MTADLPEEVLEFIRANVPSLEALQVLRLLVRTPGQPWTAREVARAVWPEVVEEDAVERFLAALVARGTLTAGPDTTVSYRPDDPAREAAVRGLLQAYDEKPVTLVRAIYRIAGDEKIQSFADAFRIRRPR